MISGGAISHLAVLCLLRLLPTTDAQIQDDTYWYGESPYVEPPIAVGLGPWSDAYSKAQTFIDQLSLEEKVNLTGGTTVDNGCSGNIAGVPRLGFDGICLTDAGQGVRATDFVSGFPSGISVGARQAAFMS